MKTMEKFKKSKFRSQFKLDEKDITYLETTGMETIKLHAYDFIKRRIAAADPKNDGKQTPSQGHPVFKAQHATATCCRACLKKWHGIEKGRALKVAEIDTCVEMILSWIELKWKKK